VAVGLGEGDNPGVGVPLGLWSGDAKGDAFGTGVFCAQAPADKRKNPRLTQDINLNVLAAELDSLLVSVKTKVNAVSFNGAAHIARDGVAVAFHI
jgi:hypothetical protein